jgi:hypothetical protein
MSGWSWVAAQLASSLSASAVGEPAGAGKVFDRTITLDEVPDGYRAMDDRKALKVLVRP